MGKYSAKKRLLAPACHRNTGSKRGRNDTTSLRSVHKVEHSLFGALLKRRLCAENDFTSNTGTAPHCNQACQANAEA